MSVALLAAASLAPSPAAGEPPRADAGAPVTASMQCDRAAEPGRVKCSAEAHAGPGRTISWADVTLVELPEFTTALKGRIGPEGATAAEPALRKWAFGLVAKKVGEGTAVARVRLVVCDATAKDGGGDATCRPLSVEVRAAVKVGG